MTRILPCALLLLGALPATASAQTVELETNAQSFLGSRFGGAMPGLRIGVEVTNQLVLSTGISGQWSTDSFVATPEAQAGLMGLGAQDSTSWSLSFPIEAKLYLGIPEAGAVVPTLRAAAPYSHTEIDDWCTMWAASGMALAGAHYFIDEHVGLGLEGGPRVSRLDRNDAPLGRTRTWVVDTAWRANLLVRL